MPCGSHGAISGILAGGILHFGTADRFLVSGSLCLVFCKIQLNWESCPSQPDLRFNAYWHKDQSEAHGDSKLYNTVVEVPARLNLK